MSSGTRYNPDAFRNMANALEAGTMDRIGRLGMSPRQMELNRLWSFYCCTQYDSRSTDWDGSKRPGSVERETIATAGFIPPGFYDAGGQMNQLPLKFRRPSSPYHLAKVIVDRFSGLLFSERRHPKLTAEGDPATEDFINALADAARLWPNMIQARRYGGATGSVAVGFQFVNGKPIVEVHDPRWVMPKFKDRINLTISSIDKRYMYPVEMRDPETGIWEPVWFWYRRTIDENEDTLYQPAPVGEGEEPEWVIAEQVRHGLGFCPVVWVQNLPVLDDIDGESDCHGVFDIVEAIDTLLSQAHRGTVANCDPTLVLENVGDLESIQIQKGSGTYIKLPTGTGKYLEIAGSGPQAARELAKELRAYALEIAQCVLDHPEGRGSERTATEIERVYSSMLSKADVLREQYGQRCIIPLIEMMIAAARKLGIATLGEDGALVRYSLTLPPRIDENGGRVPRKLGPPGAVIALQWAGYFEPGLQDALQSAQAVTAAKTAGVLDDKHAAQFIAPFFHVEDVVSMLEDVKQQKQEENEQITSDLLAQNGQLPGMGSADASDADAEKVEFTEYELNSGLVTIGEWRTSKGLNPGPYAGLTLPEFKAKFAPIFAKATGTEDEDLGAALLEKELGVKIDEPASGGGGFLPNGKKKPPPNIPA